jgi:hypothetical protein
MEIRPKEEQKHPNGHQFINKERKEQRVYTINNCNKEIKLPFESIDKSSFNQSIKLNSSAFLFYFVLAIFIIFTFLPFFFFFF